MGGGGGVVWGGGGAAMVGDRSGTLGVAAAGLGWNFRGVSGAAGRRWAVSDLPDCSLAVGTPSALLCASQGTVAQIVVSVQVPF
ncbi:hypothetical protein ACFX13_020436 [Malus domestica]